MAAPEEIGPLPRPAGCVKCVIAVMAVRMAAGL